MYTHFVGYWTQKYINLENVLKKIFFTFFLIKKANQKQTFFCLYDFVAKFWKFCIVFEVPLANWLNDSFTL